MNTLSISVSFVVTCQYGFVGIILVYIDEGVQRIFVMNVINVNVIMIGFRSTLVRSYQSAQDRKNAHWEWHTNLMVMNVRWDAHYVEIRKQTYNSSEF